MSEGFRPELFMVKSSCTMSCSWKTTFNKNNTKLKQVLTFKNKKKRTELYCSRYWLLYKANPIVHFKLARPAFLLTFTKYSKGLFMGPFNAGLLQFIVCFYVP